MNNYKTSDNMDGHKGIHGTHKPLAVTKKSFYEQNKTKKHERNRLQNNIRSIPSSGLE